MDPNDYVRALVRRWPIIAVAALIGAVFAFFGTESKPEPVSTTYQATHTLLVGANEFAQFGQATVGTVRFAQVPVFATRGEVPRRVAEQLGYSGNPASLATEVEVVADDTNGTLSFTAEDADPEVAVQIADGFADETTLYLAELQDDIRQRRVAAAQAEVNRLEEELRGLDQQVLDEIAAGQGDQPEGVQAEGSSVTRAQRDAVSAEYSTALQNFRALSASAANDLSLTQLERAQPVQLQTGGFTPPRTRSTRVPIAAGLGALLGMVIALIAERFDAKLRDRRRAEEAFGASAIAEIPTLTRRQRTEHLVVAPDQHHVAAEAFRSLRTSVTFMAAGGQPLANDDHVGVILVTSPSPADGKTTVAANLGAAFAETGRRVIVVNADFRRPQIAVAFATADRPPLPGGLAALDRVDPADWLVPTTVAGVHLLDLSPLRANPGDLTRATVRLVNALAHEADVIIVDTPPLAVTTEALEFVPASKVTIMVGRLGRTASSSAQRAGELARFGGADQLAIVVTDTGSTRLHRSRYYGYYGGKRGRDAPRDERELIGGPPPDEWLEIDELVQRERPQGKEPDGQLSADR